MPSEFLVRIKFVEDSGPRMGIATATFKTAKIVYVFELLGPIARMCLMNSQERSELLKLTPQTSF